MKTKVNRNVMAQIVQFLLTATSKELLKVILSAFEALKAFFTFKSNKHKDEKLKEETKQKEKFEKEVDNAVDKGHIEDLLDLRR